MDQGMDLYGAQQGLDKLVQQELRRVYMTATECARDVVHEMGEVRRSIEDPVERMQFTDYFADGATKDYAKAVRMTARVTAGNIMVALNEAQNRRSGQ